MFSSWATQGGCDIVTTTNARLASSCLWLAWLWLDSRQTQWREREQRAREDDEGLSISVVVGSYLRETTRMRLRRRRRVDKEFVSWALMMLLMFGHFRDACQAAACFHQLANQIKWAERASERLRDINPTKKKVNGYHLKTAASFLHKNDKVFRVQALAPLRGSKQWARHNYSRNCFIAQLS